MAKVQTFWCDLCGAEERTTETGKPETWSHCKAVREGKIRGSTAHAVLCPECEKAIKELSASLAGMIKDLLEKRKDQERPTLSGLAVLRLVSDESVCPVPGNEPLGAEGDDEEEEDDDEDEDEQVAPRKKRRGKMRREAGAGDGG